MHVSVRLENSGNGNRHLCIVGVKPRAGRKIALGKPPGSGWGLIAQHFTKRVAKAEPVQRQLHALHASKVVGGQVSLPSVGVFGEQSAHAAQP